MSEATTLPRPTLTSQAVSGVRRRRGITPRALSIRSGHCLSYVGKLEAGRIQPSLRGFSQVAAALQMNPMEVWVIVMAEASTAAAERKAG